MFFLWADESDEQATWTSQEKKVLTISQKNKEYNLLFLSFFLEEVSRLRLLNRAEDSLDRGILATIHPLSRSTQHAEEDMLLNSS